MPRDAAEASAGKAGSEGGRDRSGRSSLPEQRRSGRYEDPEARERILEATLVSAGELGFRGLIVAEVLKRYGGYRLQFYRHFANVGEAYEAAYGRHVERLELGVLKAGSSANSWRAGLRAALEELARFANEAPALANGLLVQIHLAGEPALEQRKEVLERLSHAIDSARRETRSRHSPPPLTAPLMVSAIEAAVARALTKGEPERFTEAIPELEQLICTAYFGDAIGEA